MSLDYYLGLLPCCYPHFLPDICLRVIGSNPRNLTEPKILWIPCDITVIDFFACAEQMFLDILAMYISPYCCKVKKLVIMFFQNLYSDGFLSSSTCRTLHNFSSPGCS